jgi:hypothetical protein
MLSEADGAIVEVEADDAGAELSAAELGTGAGVGVAHATRTSVRTIRIARTFFDIHPPGDVE